MDVAASEVMWQTQDKAAANGGDVQAATPQAGDTEAQEDGMSPPFYHSKL